MRVLTLWIVEQRSRLRGPSPDRLHVVQTCGRLLLALLMTGTFAAAVEGSEATYAVPEHLWSVQMEGTAHGALPAIHIKIDDSFSWPPPWGETPVYYRVNALLPDGRTISDLGRLSESERFSVVMLWPDGLRDELVWDPQAAKRTEQERRRALKRVAQRLKKAKKNADALADVLQTLRGLQPPDLAEQESEEFERISGWRFSLQPFAGEQALFQQETEGKPPEEASFTWHIETERLPEPCRGRRMKPEDCMLERFRLFRDRLCGDPRFRDSRECNHLRSLLEKDPPEPVIVCSIGPGVRGATDPITEQITIGGDYYLSGSCGDATLLHELFHATRTASESESVRRWLEAERQRDVADQDGERALAEGRLRDALVQLDRLRRLEEEKDRLRLPAIGATIRQECDAFFREITNADLFGYPGEGLSWMKQTIKDAAVEMLTCTRRYGGFPSRQQTENLLCPCLRRLRAWIDAHADVKANLSQDMSEPPGPDGQKRDWVSSFDLMLDQALRCP